MRSLFFYTLQLLIGGLQTSPVPQILSHFSTPATRPLHYPPAPPVTHSPTKPVSRSSLPPGLPVTPFFPPLQTCTSFLVHFNAISFPFHLVSCPPPISSGINFKFTPNFSAFHFNFTFPDVTFSLRFSSFPLFVSSVPSMIEMEASSFRSLLASSSLWSLSSLFEAVSSLDR